MLDLKRLRVLKEVAARGSFSAAADALYVSQSAVSQQISTLEAEVGVPLLVRLRGGPVLEHYAELLSMRHRPVMLRTERLGRMLRMPAVRWLVSRPSNLMAKTLSRVVHRIHLKDNT